MLSPANFCAHGYRFFFSREKEHASHAQGHERRNIRGSTLISHSVAGDGGQTGGHPHPARSRMHFTRGFPRTAPSLWQFLSDGSHSRYSTSFSAIFTLHPSILPRPGFGVKTERPSIHGNHHTPRNFPQTPCISHPRLLKLSMETYMRQAARCLHHPAALYE